MPVSLILIALCVGIILGILIVNKTIKGSKVFELREYVPSGNFPGIPSKNLSWKEAVELTKDSIIPMTIPRPPKDCPFCKKELEIHHSDYDSQLKQYMVWGIFCPEGHYTYITFA